MELPKVIFFDPFQDYIFHCWRNGWKMKKIIENWEYNISEWEVLGTFETVMESYWELEL